MVFTFFDSLESIKTGIQAKGPWPILGMAMAES